MSVGKNLKKLREEQKMTQEELAEKVNVSRPLITQVERGTKALSVNLALEISKVLDCTLEDLAE